MIAKCAACGRKAEKVKTLKGPAPCCGTHNALVRLDSKGEREREKRK